MSTGARTISRRMVLRGLGAGIALPMLEAMLPRRAWGADAAAEKLPMRMAYMYVPNGMHMADWKPKSEGALGDLPPTLQPLAEYKKHLNVLTGLTLDGAHAHGDGGGDHARAVAAYLTGAHPRKTDGADIRNNISADQVAADKVGGETRFSSLELGLDGSAQAGRCDSGYSCAYSSNMSWRNATTPVPKEIDPAAVFDRLFGSQTPADAVQIKDVKKRFRKSVLDYAMEDAQRLQKQLGQMDRQKLDEYLYAVRDVEKRVVNSGGMVGENGAPNYPRPSGIPRSMTDHAKLMLDMLTLAFQTDSTRVVTFMFTNAGDNRSYPDLQVSEGHHDLSHHGGSEEKQRKVAIINKYHVTLFSHVLERLSTTSEGDGVLLDRCLVMYGSGISDGDRHNHNDLPILLAGGRAAKVRTGRHIVYPDKTPLCNLHLWMLNRMGCKQHSFGDSTGELNQLT